MEKMTRENHTTSAYFESWGYAKNRVCINRGFTLIELMVVVVILGILLAILIPGLSSLHSSTRAAKSMSNMRLWGRGIVAYSTEYKGRMPWEGMKNANQMPVNFQRPEWWANAIPPYVDQIPYLDYERTHGGEVPMPPEESIFIDPSAEAPNKPYMGGGRNFFFCYVPNAQLDNTYEEQVLERDPQMQQNPWEIRVPHSFISKPSQTIMMLEIRTSKDELPKSDPWYNENLKRHMADWQRFAARHRQGGHMVFADGHTAHRRNDLATTNVQGTRDPDQLEGDWNKDGFIWDPLGPALH